MRERKGAYLAFDLASGLLRTGRGLVRSIRVSDLLSLIPKPNTKQLKVSFLDH